MYLLNKQCLSALCRASAILFVWVFWVRSRPSFLHSDSLSSCDVILILHSDWLSGLEKKEASILEMALNSFVISEINLYQSYLKASI